ncbi:MAG: hypothetical protein WKG07_32450 [Hymenobacter sp.]
MVKVFNNIYAEHLEKSGQPAGTPGAFRCPWPATKPPPSSSDGAGR